MRLDIKMYSFASLVLEEYARKIPDRVTYQVPGLTATGLLVSWSNV